MILHVRIVAHKLFIRLLFFDFNKNCGGNFTMLENYIFYVSKIKLAV